MTAPETNRGYTLLEMSIVLVIIGMIIGGITVGQSLIRQSQISSAITDVQRYVQAVQAFQTKYGALPGDFAGATAIWGGTTCPPTPPATCNGDGNGQIGMSGTATASPQEYFLFWQHLFNGQFVEGGYTGVAGSAGTDDFSIGSNAPASRVKGASFQALWAGVAGGSPYFSSTLNYGHVLLFGGYMSNGWLTGNVLKTTEAYSIDSKFDDGNPGTGNIQTWLNGNASGYGSCNIGGTIYNCATSSTAYGTSVAGLCCSLLFVTGF